MTSKKPEWDFQSNDDEEDEDEEEVSVDHTDVDVFQEPPSASHPLLEQLHSGLHSPPKGFNPADRRFSLRQDHDTLSTASFFNNADSRRRSLSMGGRVYKVTNYGDVDIDANSISSREFPISDLDADLSRRPSICPLAPDHHGTRRPSISVAMDTIPFHVKDTDHQKRLLHANHPLRRGSYTPSQISFTHLPAQTEDEEEDEADADIDLHKETKKDVNSNHAYRRPLIIQPTSPEVLPDDIDSPFLPDGLGEKVSPTHMEEGLDCLSLSTQKSLSWSKTFSLMNIARRGRLFAQRKKRRLMEKSGSCNFNLIGLERRRFKYLSDWFTTFLELQWRYIILSCLMAFCFTWFFFGLLWWGIFAAKKDTECIIGVNSFVTALLFSIETQHTIGYGTRAITDACASGIILIMLQSTVGVIIQCIATGIIFAKLARPKLRAATVIFSKQAVVCQQDGDLCLMFRVGNMRTSQMMDIKINAFLVKSKLTKEGELISFYQEHLSVTTEAEDEFYFLAWPIKAKHKITENSPLYSLSPEDLLKAEFEIIIVLEAICEATGGSIQVRTSYLPGEILWGHKLAALFPRHTTGRVKNWKYTIDFTKFNDTLPVNIPDFSARELNKRRGSKVSKIRFESECETFSNNEVYLTSSSEPKKIV